MTDVPYYGSRVKSGCDLSVIQIARHLYQMRGYNIRGKIAPIQFDRNSTVVFCLSIVDYIK